jgi:hypothetical protein
MPSSMPAAKSFGGSGMDVESIPSWPAMAESSSAQSLTSRVNVPTVSRDEANAISPYREMRP